MTLQECYNALGGSYDAVLGLMHSERLVQKFVLKFLDDKSYELLCQALSDEDQQVAFRAAHTLKGVCQNLAFTQLQESAGALTEALREQWGPEIPQLANKVHEDYQKTTAAIQAFQKELPV